MQTIRGASPTKGAGFHPPRFLFAALHDRVRLTGRGTEIRREPESHSKILKTSVVK